MPETFYLCSVTLEATNGQAKDNAVNTFALRSVIDPLTNAQLGLAADALAAFYNGVNAIGASVASFIGPSRKRTANGLVVRAYNITGKLQRVRAVDAKGRDVWRTPNIGSPVGIFGRTLGAIGGVGDALPAEVACCMSLRTAFRDAALAEVPDADADAAVDRPRARETGRIFLGPLNRGALGQEIDGERRVEANLRSALVQAADKLQDDLGAIDALSWGIWSRANGEVNEVDNVVVDNAFDTMRKRGFRSTTSTVAAL